MKASGSNFNIDELTLAGARRGDMRACEKIYRAFHKPAFTLAARICNCREMARDVTQEAFITAFRNIRQYRGDAPFWAWMKRVVVNHAISALRKLPRHQTVELQDHMALCDGDQESMGRCMDLEQALGVLSDEDRLVIWLHDVEGYKHKEIAQLAGRTESYSKTRLKRARDRLKALISDRDPTVAQNTRLNASA